MNLIRYLSYNELIIGIRIFFQSFNYIGEFNSMNLIRYLSYNELIIGIRI